MKILFINGSPNKTGNTVSMAQELLKDKDYQTLHMVDYKVYGYGQDYQDDQFDEIINEMKKADMIVLGSPLYWHSMSGMIRNFIDRFYGYVNETLLANKDFYFIFQGAAPTKEQLLAGEYTMSRVCHLYHMKYLGMITNHGDAVKTKI